MKILIIKIIIATITVFSACIVGADQNNITTNTGGTNAIGIAYVIGPGDVLDISVWKNDEMTKTVTVLPDGKITFPLIGNLTAQGKTVLELKKEVEEKISPFIPEPVLSIVVRQINSMYIYVIGRVNRPGRFELNTNVNVLQALSMAGGLNPFAKKNKIQIQREENNSTTVYKFNYDDVTKSGEVDQNIKLKRGDIIIVP